MREWLKGLTPENRSIVGKDLMKVEYGWPIGMPTCRPMSGNQNLWEVRSSLNDKRISRVLFTIADNQMVLLHAFIKKTQQTDNKEIDIAQSRKKEVKDEK